MVGVVESVSTDVISVRIDSFAPHATALNTGTPMRFPRINEYLLISNEIGATVCVITSVQIEQQPYPKHTRMQDAHLVDLPFSTRSVKLTPLGTLMSNRQGEIDDQSFKLQQGIDVFPSVGDPVLLPTTAHLRAVVEGEDRNLDRRIRIGVCPTANNVSVHVNPDKLFGRHLAILGNTGAGKSCTVAGLIRWSLKKAASKTTYKDSNVNARFIILDPNGEYALAFKDLAPRVFTVEGKGDDTTLKVPAWLWNGEEWCAFASASSQVQQPVLLATIRKLRSNGESSDIPLIDENVPKFFSVDALLGDLKDHVDEKSSNAHHVKSLISRIKGLFATVQLASITDSRNDDKEALTLEGWLEDHLGGSNQESNRTISVLDLSLVPSEIVHIVVAVLARMLFEAVKRHKGALHSQLPTVLVLDEAHTFVHREFTSGSASNAKTTCCRAFERIALEGRKFGFGLVIASQRPSEISPTVLSQCNTFLLHRIVNDEDQKLVKRLIPDGLGGLLRELPSLPSRRAILLGWGAPIPLLTEVRELPKITARIRPIPISGMSGPMLRNSISTGPRFVKNGLHLLNRIFQRQKPKKAMSDRSFEDCYITTWLL